MENFSRQMIDPRLHSLNSFIRNIIKTFSLREKTANQRILLFIGTTFKGRIWMGVVNSCLRQNGRKGRKLTSIVAGNGLRV